MTTLRDAARQALEAMDDLHRTGDTQVFDLCHRETTEALRAALAQEQTLEQEPSNPKEKEMTDPNSVFFNLNTDALPVELLRLDGSGFHYKGKVIEDAGEAYDLFKQWLAMAHQQPSAQRLTEPVQEPVQEPVYWEVRCTAHPKWMRVDEQQFDEYVAHGWEGQKLYTTPPQRKPLTDEENT